MIDPTTPDILPLTGYPWLDAIVKIAGAVGLIGSLLANVLPKGWGFTEALARVFADGRKIQAARGAVAEADAQEMGKTTVPVKPLPSFPGAP